MRSPISDDLTLCNICFDSFDSKERCPRMLTCGHTFCHSCLHKMISRKSHCGTCRAAITYCSAKEVPINYFTIGYVESLSKNNKAKEALHYKGYCDRHFLPNHFKCFECNQFICGTCCFLLHRRCLHVFPVLEATEKETAKNLQEGNLYVTKNEEKKYAKVNLTGDLINFDEWKEEKDEGSYCIDILDFINSRTTVIDTHRFIEDYKEELHNPKLPKDKIKFSQIEVKGREVYFNSFKSSGRRRLCLEFKSLVKILGCSSVIPNEAFLKPSILSGEEFVIATDGRSHRAHNFLLYASGIMDDSYQGTRLDNCYNQRSGIMGGYVKEWFSLPDIVERNQDGVTYKKEYRKRGIVKGWNDVTNFVSYFSVVMEDQYCPSKSTIGRVKRGMEVVDQITTGDSVKECGLLFDLP